LQCAVVVRVVRAAILRRLVTVATARCSAYCVFAQRFSIQPLLGSLRCPEAEQKHTPQVRYQT